MGRVLVMEHPLIQHKIGIIRRKETSSKEFRELVSEIAMFMAYEATRDLKLRDVEIETPITKTQAKELAGKKMAVIPILRAGLGMVEGMLTMVPAAKIGHIGLYRDPETLKRIYFLTVFEPALAVRERYYSLFTPQARERTAETGKFLLQIRCWLQAAPQRLLFPC